MKSEELELQKRHGRSREGAGQESLPAASAVDAAVEQVVQRARRPLHQQEDGIARPAAAPHVEDIGQAHRQVAARQVRPSSAER